MITKVCLIASFALFALFTGLLVYSVYWGDGGNHWFLFGTWIDRVLVGYGPYVALLASLPLAVPLLFNRTLSTGTCAVLSIGMFFYLSIVIDYLSD